MRDGGIKLEHRGFALDADGGGGMEEHEGGEGEDKQMDLHLHSQRDGRELRVSDTRGEEKR